MITPPLDIVDLYLAPVTLSLDQRLNELAEVAPEDLDFRVALETNVQPKDKALRAEALLGTITYLVELHDWRVSWHPRGLLVSHRHHELVLGLPPNLRDYLER